MFNITSHQRSLGIIILGAILVSFTSVFVNLAHVGPSVSAFYRMFFGGLVLIVVTWLRKDKWWNGFRGLWLPVLCALFFSLDLFFWHRSILYVGPGLATILGNMQVFFVALFAVLFLNEKLGWQRLVSIPVAMAGLFLIVRTGWYEQSVNFKTGVAFGLLTALLYAWYILALRKSRSAAYKQKTSLLGNMAIISLLSAAFLGISVVIESDAGFVIPDLQSWGALLGLGLVGQVFGWVMISKGLPDVDASAAGLALLLQPALAFGWDILIFNRPTTVMEYIGAFVVLAAVYMGSIKDKDTESHPEYSEEY